MTFEEAIRKSMKAYYQDVKTASKPDGKKNKYTKSYFDKVAKEYNIEPVELEGKKDY